MPTAPRQIIPGRSYLLTRCCSERRFLLKPSGLINAIVLYALAHYASRHGILVHGFCVLSNHYHLVATDVRGVLPDFLRDLNGVLARAVNQARGRSDGFWERESYSAVRLVDPEDMLRKLVYTLANPVQAGLISRASEWPGLWSDPDDIGGRPLKARRPEGFFDDEGDMPEKVELQLVPPLPFEGDPAFHENLVQGLREAEALATAKLKEEGRSFLGLAGILSQSIYACPAQTPRFELNPRVACVRKWKRIETLLRLKEFVQAYKEALAAWRSGVRDVLFPPGTWHMRVVHAARCASYG